MKVVTKENSSITYYIDEDKRTIVCKMTDCENDFMKSVSDISLTGYELKSYYIGKAKCHPDDTWDEETGKQIALYKMLYKYYTDKLKYSKKLLDSIHQHYEFIQNMYYANQDKRLLCDVQLYQLCSECSKNDTSAEEINVIQE